MTAKRFIIPKGYRVIKDNVTNECATFYDNNDGEIFLKWLNELHEENGQLKQQLSDVRKENYGNLDGINYYQEQNGHLSSKISDLECENEQLKQDNNALIHLLENQSMIIEELHSKLLEYQIQEPIVLTKEDLELMGKAVSYYTHGRYGE